MAQRKSSTRFILNSQVHNVSVKFVRTKRNRKQPKGRSESNEVLIIKIK